jgi:hypothetical protein
VLNNCWFMNRDIISYRLRFRAYNAARLVTEGSYDVSVREGSLGV